MKFFTYDCEVTAYDWLFVFKEKSSGEYTVIHNDNDYLTEFLNEEDLYCGFNSKAYDQFIVKAVVAGFTPEQVKELSDYLIKGGRGWEYEPLRGTYLKFNNVDIFDDTQRGLSLKAIEGHLGMSIQETTVDFDLKREWTDEELQEMIYYCKHDVDATEKLIDVRSEYLKTKINIGKMAGLDEAKALSMTNAKLTAAFLQARKPEEPWTDERQYVIPENLKREYIPQEVFDFFARMYDKSLSDEDVFDTKLNIDVGGTPTVIGYGGIHAAIPNYMWEEGMANYLSNITTTERIIRNFDVGSYYPHLMTINGYTSRNMPHPEVYAEMLERRMQAKKSGDKQTANALKLIANTTYGATLNQYNELYDPLKARSVCISGQLYLLELANHLIHDVPTLKIVQLNTDGIMIEFNKRNYQTVKDITNEWQERTGFSLEEDEIKEIVQKDVNNYIEMSPEGKPKAKGGYLVRGIAPAGAFNINNNAIIVAEAIWNYFVNKRLPEDTVNECDDISKFQLIAKAGAKYKDAYHMVNGEKQPIQKVNRVYATNDETYGKLYKVKAADDSEAKIEKLPEHCIIDNSAINDPNHTKIDKIDKAWYIQQAKDGINKFLGIDEKKTKERKPKMPTAKTEPVKPNVYQKLLTARCKFLESQVQKSGKNMKLKYKYFELDDIVPVALPIFQEVGLLPVTTFTNEFATMRLYNVEAADGVMDYIEFTSPMREIEPIVSSTTGGEVTNAIQRLGAVETYQRRYLYMIALDIVEADEMEAMTGMTPDVQVPAPAPKPPVTPIEREQIKQQLTSPEAGADELQLAALKEAVKKLRKSGKEEKSMAIALETKGFTTVSKTRCEELIKEIASEVENA